MYEIHHEKNQQENLKNTKNTIKVHTVAVGFIFKWDTRLLLYVAIVPLGLLQIVFSIIYG